MRTIAYHIPSSSPHATLPFPLQRPMNTRVNDAIYKLKNPLAQIDSYVGDVVRAQVPQMTLDEVRKSFFFFFFQRHKSDTDSPSRAGCDAWDGRPRVR